MLTTKQIDTLLRPIDPARVAERDGMHHLQVWDVRRWLIRVFGHTGFSIDVLDVTMLYEDTEHVMKSGNPGVSVGYRATVRLTIHGWYGANDTPLFPNIATYTECATGDGIMPTTKRADAHDFAIKTAVSQATKRCAVNLGDQFGLSLYANTPNAVVKNTVPHAERTRAEDRPEQPDEGEQVEHDEPVKDEEHDPTVEPTVEPPEQVALKADPTAAVEGFVKQLEEAKDITDKRKRASAVSRIAIQITQAELGKKQTGYGVTLDALVDWSMTGKPWQQEEA